jgi:hypothetical protein
MPPVLLHVGERSSLIKDLNGAGCVSGPNPNEPGLRVARRRTGHAVPASPEYHGDKDDSRGQERTLAKPGRCVP